VHVVDEMLKSLPVNTTIAYGNRLHVTRVSPTISRLS
jgi:hypothetical protein